VFLLRHFFGAAGTSPQVPVIRDITLPVLSRSPGSTVSWAGRTPWWYLALVAVFLVHVVIYKDAVGAQAEGGWVSIPRPQIPWASTCLKCATSP